MRLSERAASLSEQARRASELAPVLLAEGDGERLVFCRESVRYRLDALGPDGWAVVASSARLCELVGLEPVPGFHDRLAERFPRAWGLPFDAADLLRGGGPVPPGRPAGP